MLANSLLWKVSSIEGKPSYVFGTMHAKDEAAYSHIDLAKQAMYKCADFYTEINLAAASEKMSSRVYMLPETMTLRQLISERHFQRMEQILYRSFGFPLALMNNYLPLIVVNKIAENILSEDRHLALDAYLWEEAKRMNMHLAGLETLEEQVSLLQSIDIEIQLKSLKDLCANVGKFRKSVMRLSELYTDQNIISLYKQTKHSLGSLRKVMLYDRNTTMARRIKANLSTSSFYAIGAAHLAGNKGVLALLKKEGVQLTCIRNTNQ